MRKPDETGHDHLDINVRCLVAEAHRDEVVRAPILHDRRVEGRVVHLLGEYAPPRALIAPVPLRAAGLSARR